MRRAMRRKPLILLALLLAVLAAGHGLYWGWAAGRLEARIAEWRAEQEARGLAVAYRGPQITGYPTRLSVRFEEPALETPNGWHWSGPAVTGQAALWAPFTIDLAFPGRHEVGHPALDAPLQAALEEGTARVRLRGDGRVEQAEIALRALEIESLAQGPAGVASLDATLGPLIEARGDSPQRFEVTAEATGVRLPDFEDNPLGPNGERVALTGTLLGPTQAGEPRAALEAWRDAGGTAEIASLEALWGPLALAGEGTLALDRELRPLGAFDARVSGLDDTIDVLARKKLIENGAALAIKLGLAMVVKDSDARGRPLVRLPITLQNGRLNLLLGGVEVALVRLPPVI